MPSCFWSPWRDRYGSPQLALTPGGFGILDIAALVLFAVTLPWMVAGFCNAVIGFIIMRFSADPVAAVLPAAGLIGDDEPVTASTAILLCVRNELPLRIIRNLEPMLEGIHASGYGERFHLYLLSDTSDADLAVREEALFSELIASWRDRIAISYRRRTVNVGFKAGNIREFCERWGSRHEFAVTLDADSFMPADAIIRLVRIMQVDPRLGILQGLIVGLPSTSLFARIFQFGMRLGMRSYTIGSAWWQSDCGPYWGHNAVLRLEPFIKHCQLPLLSGSGEEERHILSHDQIEAALMRAAGYHVRVVPREDLGWEENPPTLLEFMRRDLRWCQGNMQYWRFLLLPNLRPVSRYQLVLAILMFIGSPAWIGLLVLATIALVRCDDPATIMRADAGSALLAWVLVMWFSPKIAGALDVLLSPEERRAFGGAGRFTVNFVIETDVLDHPVSDPLDQSHDLSLWPAVQSRDQLDGAGPRRSRGAFEPGVARSLAADPCGMRSRSASCWQASHGHCRTFSCWPAGRPWRLPLRW